MFNPPKNIIIKSDDNELEFIKTVKTKTELMYEYKFIKSKTKLGTVMLFTEKELMKCLSSFLFIEI